MARLTKCRRVCHFPGSLLFTPSQSNKSDKIITLTVDEYEAIRLIDKEGMSQEKCAAYMQVARTTVQKIYEEARKKLAQMLVDGFMLKIEGGEYRLCDGRDCACEKLFCKKREFIDKYYKEKGDGIMRIAVTHENGQIFGHFGHTEQFKIYDVKDGNIVSSEIVDTNGSGHGALAEMLHALNVDVLICGGIGGGAQIALRELGIKIFGGVSGSADDAVGAFAAGSLEYNPNVKCDHHDHEHGAEAHTCGAHGCGHGHCGNR